MENRRRRHLADRLVRPGAELYIVGTGNPYPIYDPQFRPGDNLYTNSAIAINVDTGKLAWYFQYTPNDSWDFDEVGVHMLYDTTIDGVKRKVVGHYGRNGFYYTLDRTTGKFIRSEKYVNDLNWTKGIDQKTGKPMKYSPKLDVQLYNPEARALRGDGTNARARRGMAASRISRSRSTRSRTSPTASAPKAASRRTARRSNRAGPRAVSTTAAASRASTAATFTTAP